MKKQRLGEVGGSFFSGTSESIPKMEEKQNVRPSSGQFFAL